VEATLLPLLAVEIEQITVKVHKNTISVGATVQLSQLGSKPRLRFLNNFGSNRESLYEIYLSK
jgi:hypothetical protein